MPAANSEGRAAALRRDAINLGTRNETGQPPHDRNEHQPVGTEHDAPQADIGQPEGTTDGEDCQNDKAVAIRQAKRQSKGDDEDTRDVNDSTHHPSEECRTNNAIGGLT